MAAAAYLLPSKCSGFDLTPDVTRASMEAKEGSSTTHRMSSASCATASAFHAEPAKQHETVQIMTRHRRKQQVPNLPAPRAIHFDRVMHLCRDWGAFEHISASDVLSKRQTHFRGLGGNCRTRSRCAA